MLSSLSGLSFFTPWALWALLALAIPILIHLFNRSRGRLVRIGHIDLIRQARKLRVTEVKPAQWLLLLLRLAIFTLAALLLAGLAQPGLNSSDSPTAYVSPAWIRTASASMLDELISSSNQGSRIIVLQTGLERLDKDLADSIRETPVNASNVSNIWPLLAEQLSLEHHTGVVDVYVSNYLQQLGSNLPALPRAVNWNVANPETTLEPNGLPKRVVIAFDRQRSRDAEIMTAAINSLKVSRIPNIRLELVESQQLTTEQLKADWLILLSENELSAEQLTSLHAESVVLMDVTGEMTAAQPEYHSLPFYPFSTFSVSGIGPSGLPLMQSSRAGDRRLIRFNSRFNPRWSSITRQVEFPVLLMQLMSSGQQQKQSFADARITADHLELSNNRLAAEIPLPRHSLQSTLAMLLALLWILERWLSERKKREPS
jgi:hypothetical protein